MARKQFITYIIYRNGVIWLPVVLFASPNWNSHFYAKTIGCIVTSIRFAHFMMHSAIRGHVEIDVFRWHVILRWVWQDLFGACTDRPTTIPIWIKKKYMFLRVRWNSIRGEARNQVLKSTRVQFAASSIHWSNTKVNAPFPPPTSSARNTYFSAYKFLLHGNSAALSQYSRAHGGNLIHSDPSICLQLFLFSLGICSLLFVHFKITM